MKNENIPAFLKSKSLKELREEIDQILTKLERNDIDLNSSFQDYQKLIELNKRINQMFREKVKEISKDKKILNDKKKIK